MQNSIVSLLGSHLRNLWVKRAPAIPPSVRAHDASDRPNWTNIYRDPQSSLLFRNVLAGEGEQQPERQAANLREEARPATAARTAKIGDALGTKAAVVCETGKELALLTDPQTTRFINDALSSLNRQFCRVAFVGQMNSGKSSLINVLTQRPDFLPTDINPWTTVVTNLCFGGRMHPMPARSFASSIVTNGAGLRREARGSRN